MGNGFVTTIFAEDKDILMEMIADVDDKWLVDTREIYASKEKD